MNKLSELTKSYSLKSMIEFVDGAMIIRIHTNKRENTTQFTFNKKQIISEFKAPDDDNILTIEDYDNIIVCDKSDEQMVINNNKYKSSSCYISN